MEMGGAASLALSLGNRIQLEPEFSWHKMYDLSSLNDQRSVAVAPAICKSSKLERKFHTKSYSESSKCDTKAVSMFGCTTETWGHLKYNFYLAM